MADVESYPELVRELAGLRQALAAQEQAAQDWYVRQLAEAQETVGRAEQLADEAADRVDTAQAGIERVDTDAALLWRALGARLGRGAARRLGSPPAPAALADGELPDTDPLLLLRRVRARLDTVPARRVRPLWLTVLFALAGLAAVGTLTYLVVTLMH
jgi:hypothetical protein